MLLFKTNCKKPKKDEYGDITETPDPVDYDKYQDRWNDTRVVWIQSSAKLEMEPLDRMAHISGCEQDMNSDTVIALAVAIWRCLSDNWVNADRVTWAAELNMRSRTRTATTTSARSCKASRRFSSGMPVPRARSS